MWTILCIQFLRKIDNVRTIIFSMKIFNNIFVQIFTSEKFSRKTSKLYKNNNFCVFDIVSNKNIQAIFVRFIVNSTP